MTVSVTVSGKEMKWRPTAVNSKSRGRSWSAHTADKTYYIDKSNGGFLATVSEIVPGGRRVGQFETVREAMEACALDYAATAVN